MRNNMDVQRFFPIDSERLFSFFTKKELMEQWAAPTGMKLKLPIFEARTGGQYRYEHTDLNGGMYVCEGEFKEVIPEEKIVQLDRFIKDPQGKLLDENLECIITFDSKFGGTEVHISQKGFKDEKSADQCLEGWAQCLDKLSQFVNRETGYAADGIIPENEQDIRG